MPKHPGKSLLTLLAVTAFSTCGSGPSDHESMPADINTMVKRRIEMVQTQLESRDIVSDKVLDIMRSVPRERFVPPAVQGAAYEDGPLPIGEGQTISQPYIVALMTQMLDLRPGDRVLEIGTGSGYQTAVLAELSDQVYTVEIIPGLLTRAQKILNDLGYTTIHYRLGDGWRGWAEKAPFDKIIVTAAPDKIPADLVDQLREGGTMLLPVGGENQYLTIGVKKGGVFKTVKTIPVRFVPLVKGTAPEETPDGEEGGPQEEKR